MRKFLKRTWQNSHEQIICTIFFIFLFLQLAILQFCIFSFGIGFIVAFILTSIECRIFDFIDHYISAKRYQKKHPDIFFKEAWIQTKSK